MSCQRRIEILSIALRALAALLIALVAWSGRARAEVESFKIGVFVASIHNLNMAGGSYGADLWIWSLGPSTRDPLNSVEFVNSETLDRRLPGTAQRGPLTWRQAKVVGTFRQAWTLRDFPFDTQELELRLEEGDQDVSELVYVADVENSGFAPTGSPPGWRITGFKIRSGATHYDTNFGDPADQKAADYANVVVSISLQRVGRGIFLNLGAPLYASFLLCVVTFLLHKDGYAIVESRIALLAAALFAVVLNIRSANAMLGDEHALTIVDRLHILVVLDIAIATVVTVYAGIARNNDKRIPLWRDYAICGVLIVSFAAVNASLIHQVVANRP